MLNAKGNLTKLTKKTGMRWFSGLAAVLFVALWGTPAQAFSISTCDVIALCPIGTPTEGWDGPGLGSVTIDYYVGNPFQSNMTGLPTGIGLAAFETELTAAQSTWSSAVQVSWNKISDSIADPTGALTFQANQITIYSAGEAAGVDHGDDLPFDGAWNPTTPPNAGFVLGHAFAPPDIDGGSGNVHLDGQETWVTSGATIGATSATIDLQSILVHELGHSLGLGHSAVSGALMQPVYFGILTALQADDIAGITSLYCPTGEICNDIIEPPNGVVPEPGTLLLLSTGLIALGLSRRRQAKDEQ